MIHLIGIPVLLVVGGVLDRLFFNKAKAAVDTKVREVQADVTAVEKKL